MKKELWRVSAAVALFALAANVTCAQESHGGKPANYQLAQGDAIHIQVFQNPDLTLDTRVSDDGSITYPLIGKVSIGGLPIDAAEQRIAKALKDGGFVQQPQVNIALVTVRGNQVDLLGMVNHPGRYPLDTANTRLTDILALAGGVVVPDGSDMLIVVGTRDGKPYRREIDVPAIFLDGRASDDIVVAPGDVIYVHRAPMYYIYGQVAKGGSYRVERGMTVQQALAEAGGPTLRGSENRLRLDRRDSTGKVVESTPQLTDQIQPNDVLYVKESLF